MTALGSTGADDTLNLSFATWDHDRVMALHGGRIEIPGVSLQSVVKPTAKLFPLAVSDAPYDITEMSVSSYILQVSRGDAAYVALPAFVSRAFRHSGFFVRKGSGITSLAEYAGKKIGVPEYQMTAALWMRGILKDEAGVAAEDVHWVTGALDEGVRRERLELALPDTMKVTPIQDGQTLQQLLLDGEIDGLLAPKPPSAFLAGNPEIERVFPDFEKTEQAYFEKTGFFPLMHLIGVRKSLCDAHPWLPKALYEGLVASRDMALSRLRDVWLGNANRLSLPWLGASMEKTLAIMGQRYWRYGVKDNQAELEAVCRYSSEQYLSARRVDAQELFHPSVMAT